MRWAKILRWLMLMNLFPILLMGQGNRIELQELVLKDGKPFTGEASFKFAVVSGSSTLWSHDGSSFHGAEPAGDIILKVTGGIFSVELGNETMKPFYYEILKVYPNAQLLTWVNTGDGFVLQKERNIDPSLYASIVDMEPPKVKSEPAPIIYASTLKKDKNKEKQKEAMNPEGIMMERFKQRAGSSGAIPMDALLNAKKHIEGMPQPKDAGLWNWEWLGPSNIGGRIRAIAIHPTSTNTMFIGGVSGGIWKSTNGGSSWSVIDDFLPSLAITSIVYDPANPTIMYAATGEGFYNHDALPGAGIFKSTNGGTSWTQLSSTNNANFTLVNRLAHHPDSTGVLYAATRDPNRVWKTRDGGATWNSILNASHAVTDVRVSTHGTHNMVIAGCWGYHTAGWANSGDVYLSSNWGQTWTEQTTGAVNKLPVWPMRCEVTFCPSNSSRIYVVIGRNSGEIWRSDDSGATWTQMDVLGHLGGQQWYNNCIWVDPTNSLKLVVGGIDNWRSTDGGSTWTQISDWHDYHNNGSANSAHADNHIIINHPSYDGSTNKVVFFGNDGGIQKATDILTTAQNSGWVNLAGTSLGITQFFGVSAAPDGSYICGGTQDNDHLRYKSSGTWSGANNWYQAETGDGGAAAINYNNTTIQYSEYTNLVIQKSTNSGNSWFDAYSGITDAGTDNALFISPFSMDPNDPARLIAGGATIWRTTNSAGAWSSIRGTQTGTPKCSAIDIADGNSSIIWVGYEDGHVAFTTNGTASPPTWTRVDNNATALPNRYVTDIAINPNNHDEVYVTFGEYQNNNVWYTSNSGTGWTNRSGTAPNDLPALQVNTVRVHPLNSNWIYIGTDMGLFASEDKGQNWSVDPRYPTEGHEFPSNVEIHELCWQGDYFLIAATFGRGMYRAHPMVVIYVDLNAAAGGNGSAAAPYNNVEDALNAMGPGTTISIKSNTYDEPYLMFNKRGMIITTNGSSIIK
ncbi:MAG: hypothetical protein FJY10_02180 [Bacteroidetes bacterium]|nr:hypothetical protein [Bacteroidota bacterium]